LVPLLVGELKGGKTPGAPFAELPLCCIAQKRAVFALEDRCATPGALHLGVVSGDELSATITAGLTPHRQVRDVPYLGRPLPTGVKSYRARVDGLIFVFPGECGVAEDRLPRLGFSQRKITRPGS